MPQEGTKSSKLVFVSYVPFCGDRSFRFLSDDMLEGRGTGARGGELAAKYIAAQLETLGAKGAGADGSLRETLLF